MSNVASWIDRVEQALADLAGPDYAKATATPWRERANAESVHVTLYGPYDAGKTTLIKRLLVADGVKPPEWLTISGRPETMISGAVEAGPLTYQDTPGTASGNEAHDDGAAGTAMLTDILLITMTPRLFSDAEGDGGPLLRAAREHGRAARFVITQSDRLSADPVEQPDEHRELVAGKKRELAELLNRAGLRISADEIHVVSADPFGGVGSDPAPSAGDYEDGAGWDGVAGLHADLARQAADRAGLRQASAVRYWRAVGARALATADATAAQMRADIRDARHNLERAALGRGEIDVVDRTARAELLRDITAELHSAGSTVAGGSVESVLPVIEHRLQDRIGRWATVWSDKLTQAIDDAAQRLPQGLAQPSVSLQSYLRSVAGLAGGERPTPGSHLPTIIGRAERDAKILSDAIFQHQHFMSPATAKAELERFRNVKPDKLQEYLDTGGRIANADTSKAIEKSLSRSESFVRVLPVLVEIGGAVFEGVQSHLHEQKVQQERKRLREEIDNKAREITELVLGDESAGGVGWAIAVAAAHRGLGEQAPDPQVPDSLQADLDHLSAARTAFARVLAERPASIGTFG